MANKPRQIIIYYLVSIFGMTGMTIWIGLFVQSSPKWWLMALSMLVLLFASVLTATAANQLRKQTKAFTWGASVMVRLTEFSTLTIILSFLAMFVFLWLALSSDASALS